MRREIYINIKVIVMDLEPNLINIMKKLNLIDESIGDLRRDLGTKMVNLDTKMEDLLNDNNTKMQDLRNDNNTKMEDLHKDLDTKMEDLHKHLHTKMNDPHKDNN